MENITYEQLPDPQRLKEILLIQAAMDIIMKDKEDAWLRLVNFYKDYKDGIDMFKFDNGAGDNMYIIFSQEGVIIKGFDHESILSPYDNEKGEIAKGIYDLVPDELIEVLQDESIEMNDVTFCIWRRNTDSNWKKGKVDVPETYEEGDDGEGFLLGYIYEDPASWLEWAKYYYSREIPIDYIKNIYEHRNITKEVLQKINPERDAESVMKELKEIDFISIRKII